MLADNIAASDCGKTDVAAIACAGDAIAARDFGCVQRDVTACGGGFAQHQRGAGGGIDLVAVMRFDDLDIPVGVQSGGDFLGQAGEKVDAKAHVASLNDHGVMGGGVEFGVVMLFQPGGADDMHGAGLGGEGGKFNRGTGGCEVDHGLRDREGFQRVVGDFDAEGGAADADADVLPDPGVAGALDAADKGCAGVGGDAADQHLTHAARGAGDGDAGKLGHGGLRFLAGFSGFQGGVKARRCGRGRIGVNGGMANTRSYSAKGPSQRQLRVGELIRRTLSEILARGEVHDPVLNDMSITVGEVSVSVDLKVATVYVMPLLGGATVEQAIAALAKNAWELRKRVSAEMTLRHSPELRFRPDDTFDRLEEARRLFADPKVQADIAKPDDAAPEAQE